MYKQNGSALVVTLVVLAFLAVIGIAGLNTSDLELFSSRTTRDFRENFYIADGGLNREIMSYLDYDFVPPVTEEIKPYRIARAANGTFPDCPNDSNCTSTNATLGDDHFVINNFYDYAVDFRKIEENVTIPGFSGSLKIITYRIFTQTSPGNAVRGQGYYFTTN